MKFKLLVSVVIFVIFALICPISAATYYVDSASTGGDGTTTAVVGTHAAFKTIAAAQATVTGDQHGNSLLFKCGQIWFEQFTIGAYGTVAGRFTIGTYGTGAKPIISGRDYAVVAVNKDYITIDGLQLEGGNVGTVVIYSNNTTGWTVKNCTIHNNIIDGITLIGLNNPDSEMTDVLLTNNIIVANVCGIKVYRVKGTSGHEIVISYNDISGTGVNGGGLSGIELRSSYTIVEHNDVHGCGSRTLAVSGGGGIHSYSGGITEDNGDYNIIRYNKVHGNYGTQHDGYGIAIDQWCDHNQVYYNIIYDSDGPGMSSYDAIGTEFYNNTLYNNWQNSPGTGFHYEFEIIGDRTSGVIAKNNLIYSTKSDVYAIMLINSLAGCVVTNNLYYKSPGGNWWGYQTTIGASLPTWNGYAEVGTDKYGDPLMVNPGVDFHLMPNSPCIGAGVSVGLTRDYAGNQIVGPNIGAYENTTGKMPISAINLLLFSAISD